MSEEPIRTTDPRLAGGDIAGPGGPHDRNGVVIDATHAVLLDDVTVAIVEGRMDGRPAGPPVMAMQLSGRINKSQDRARILFIFDDDGAAGIVSELLALSVRNGGGDGLLEILNDRMERLVREGNL